MSKPSVKPPKDPIKTSIKGPAQSSVPEAPATSPTNLAPMKRGTVTYASLPIPVLGHTATSGWLLPVFVLC